MLPSQILADIITPAIKHIHCHAGLDPVSSPMLDSRIRGNDGFDIYCCRNNKQSLLLRKLILRKHCFHIIIIEKKPINYYSGMTRWDSTDAV
ncbi:MAG: hypothetical protein ABFD82_19335 [Syntrophaceae bacterium]